MIAADLSLSDPMHRPGAYVRRYRCILDADGDWTRWGYVWSVEVPGVGSVGEWPDHCEREARAILAAYLDPAATRRSVLEARAAQGCGWAARELAGSAS